MNTVRGTCGVGTEIESVESDNYRGNAMKTTINRDGLIWAICALAVLALGSALAVRPAGGGINGGGKRGSNSSGPNEVVRDRVSHSVAIKESGKAA